MPPYACQNGWDKEDWKYQAWPECETIVSLLQNGGAQEDIGIDRWTDIQPVT